MPLASMAPIQMVSPSPHASGKSRGLRLGDRFSLALQALGRQEILGIEIQQRGICHHGIANAECPLGGLYQAVQMLEALTPLTPSREKMPRIMSDASPWVGGGML